MAKVEINGDSCYKNPKEGVLGLVPNTRFALREPRRMRLEEVQLIVSVLGNSCVKCYVVFVKRLQMY